MDFDGDFVIRHGGQRLPTEPGLTVVNPATREPVATVPDVSRDQLDRAVAAARAAFPGWRGTALEERQRIVKAMAARLAAHADAFARLLTREQGKPLSEAQYEIGASIHWLSEVAGQSPPVEVVADDAERRIETRHVPLGVVGGIVPWNFPMSLAIWKIAPALVTGNTLILKPSPFTPLTLMKFVELVDDLLPPGVLTIVTGGDRLGPWITEHPGIDKISFTGSTQTGRAIMRSASETLKRVTLELGGNDPAIVLPDADVDTVVPRLFWAAFTNNAQFCLAAKRIYVHDGLYDRFADAFAAYARAVRSGNGADSGTQMGPIQNEPQFRRVAQMLADARSEGVRFLTGGDVEESPGYFIPVSIADDPPEGSAVVREEAFGPILPLLRYSSIDEVVRRANDSIYGLGASVWGADLALAQQVADRLEAGTVWINTIHELSPAFAFGGHKQSGIGVENGIAGLLEYTNAKTVIVNKQPVAAS